MVAARSAFLDRGYYAPLRDALCARTAEECKALPSPALLDSGCGEGYYTAGAVSGPDRRRVCAQARRSRYL